MLWKNMPKSTRAITRQHSSGKHLLISTSPACFSVLVVGFFFFPWTLLECKTWCLPYKCCNPFRIVLCSRLVLSGAMSPGYAKKGLKMDGVEVMPVLARASHLFLTPALFDVKLVSLMKRLHPPKNGTITGCTREIGKPTLWLIPPVIWIYLHAARMSPVTSWLWLPHLLKPRFARCWSLPTLLCAWTALGPSPLP